MKATHYIIASIVLMAGSFAFGQQESQFINVANNPYMLNPAAGGMSGVMQFELSSRMQWMGYNGGPRTFLFTGNSEISAKKGEKALSEFNVKDEGLFSNPDATLGEIKHIVGGRAMNDAIGPFAKTSIFGSYAIHLPFSKKLNFGAGVGIGWSNFRIDEERVILYQENDGAYNEFLGNASGQNMLDASAGIVFYNNHFQGGLSTSQVFKNHAIFDNVETLSYYARHFFLTAKYRFDVSDKISLEPMAVAKYTKASPISLDAGLRIAYNRAAWLGLHYRTSNAVVVQVGVNIVKNIYVNYGYEFATGAISTANNSTHEIQLGFYLGRNRNMDKEMKEGAE